MRWAARFAAWRIFACDVNAFSSRFPMTSGSAPSGFSLLRIMGRLSAQNRGMQFGASHSPRAPAAALPSADHAALKARLAPVLAALDRDRADHAHKTERQLRLAVAGAGLAGLVLGWSMFGGILGSLVLMAGAAVFALLVLFQQAQAAPRLAVKAGILGPVADHLTGFATDPAPTLSPEAFARLRLLPPVRKATVDLRLTGQLGGRDMTVSRVGLMFGQDHNYTEKQGDGVAFVMVGVATPETAQSGAFTAIMATDAARSLQMAPKRTHGLSAVPSGDAGFDARYTVYGDPAPVTPGFRAGLAVIEAPARCAKQGLTEVSPGTGLRPWVVLLPGQLIVLTPLALFDGAFEPAALVGTNGA